jgi:uncharacterized membrane protein
MRSHFTLSDSRFTFPLQGHTGSISLIILFSAAIHCPFLAFGFAGGVDSAVYRWWSALFTDQLFDGNIYPRWLLDGNGGYGSPAFLFYGPAAYYLAAPFNHLFGTGTFSTSYGWYEYGVLMFFVGTMSCVTVYLWLDSVFSKRTAVSASIMFLLLPYKLFFLLYGLSALSQQLALDSLTDSVLIF